MIIVKLSGGLGNQMFQYATGLRVALEHNTELKIDLSAFRHRNISDTHREFCLNKFQMRYILADENDINKVKFPFGLLSKISYLIKKKVLRQHFLDYHPEIFKIKNNVYLDGYFQSEKNFSKYPAEIKKIFSLKREYTDGISNELRNEILSDRAVSIHIRRGDYAKDRKTNKYHGLCPISYYEKAISLMATKINDPHFYIFSDDVEWVKRNLLISYPHTFVSDGKLIPQQEMHLMSKCKHNIIANSSFSWWGAWLNENPGKIVIAPKKWVNIEPDPHPNIIPKTWITI